jgi:hypothetical protein
MSCTQTFDHIMAEARVRMPGAVDNALKVELFSVIDDFMKETHVWQETIPVGVLTTQNTYDLDSNEWVAVIHELLYVVNKDNIPLNASMAEAGTLFLYNYPQEDQTYNVRVALTVANQLDADGYPQVPQWIVTRYREYFSHGLICKMAMQPAKPYTNETLAKFHGMMFNKGKTIGYADGKQQNTYNTQAWRFPQSFATSRRQ